MTQVEQQRTEPKVVEWYISMLQFANASEERSLTKFYETAKLLLAISGGILVLVSFAITRERLALVLAIFLCILGIWLCITWIRQISIATSWNTRWYSSVKRLEETQEFARVVGTDVKIFADPKIDQSADPQFVVRYGTTARLYRSFAWGFLVLYGIVGIGSLVYLWRPQLFTQQSVKADIERLEEETKRLEVLKRKVEAEKALKKSLESHFPHFTDRISRQASGLSL